MFRVTNLHIRAWFRHFVGRPIPPLWTRIWLTAVCVYSPGLALSIFVDVVGIIHSLIRVYIMLALEPQVKLVLELFISLLLIITRYLIEVDLCRGLGSGTNVKTLADISFIDPSRKPVGFPPHVILVKLMVRPRQAFLQILGLVSWPGFSFLISPGITRLPP